jgi:3-deoxy-7-phosphoheptulonate synthase
VPLSKAAVAAEADGLMVESHHEPQEALCDGEQALPVEALMGMKDVLQPFASAMGREVI